MPAVTRAVCACLGSRKAGAPTLKQQVAAAYATDMCVTNPLFRGTDKKPDISNRVLDATTFYTASLAVPRARRQDEAGVQRGKASFTSFGCAQCHTAELRTTAGATAALCWFRSWLKVPCSS